jgi:exonuclease III
MIQACVKMSALNPNAGHMRWPWRMQVFRRTCYQIATAVIAQTASEATVYKSSRFSDHAPLTIDYDLGL